jgi:hypothetical protein
MTLPRIDRLLEARAWLFAGAPAASRDHDPVQSVRTLIELVEGLPGVLPVYCHATPEHRAQRELEQRDPNASGPHHDPTRAP